VHRAAHARRVEEVLSAERLRPRLEQLGFSSSDLVAYALHLSTVFEVPAPPTGDPSPIVAADPDDDVFVRCAEVSVASYLVSGDRHLLEMGQYQEINILSPAAFLERTFPEEG
jgi:predicted nucleic acid-binding protein